MAARPGDETTTAREEVIEALTAAFIEGRLGRDEFDQGRPGARRRGTGALHRAGCSQCLGR